MRERRRLRKGPYPWAFGMFALGALLTLGAYGLARRLASHSIAAEVDLMATHLSVRLQTCVGTRVEMISQIRREWSLGGLRDEESFGRRIDALIETFPGYLAVNQIDQTGMITHVYPAAHNAHARHRRVTDTPAAATAFRAALDSGKPHMSAPVELFQGGTGLVVYVPTRTAENVPLVLNGVFRATPLIDHCLPGDGAYALELSDDQKPFYARELNIADMDYAVTRPIKLVGRTWTLRAAPWQTRVAASTAAGRLIAINGLVLSALLGGLGFLFKTLRDRARAERLEAEAAREAERKRVEAKLQQMHRMESLGHMASAVAHDFNNLLTVIITSAHLVKESRSSDERTQAATDIEQTARRGAALTKELVAFGRGDNSPLAPVNLASILGSMRSLLARLAGDAVTLNVEAAAGPVTILGSVVQVEQIIVNLVTNAVAAMPEGGTLSLVLSATDSTATLRVSDTGTGIDPELVPRIFEPFFTTKPVDVGTGLGLATVYSHVRRMNGDVSVDSVPGRGTTFTLTFPRVPEST